MATEATELLARAGRALYGGDAWQAPLARALGVNPRTVRKWLDGDGSPPREVLRRAHGLLIERRREITATANEIAASFASV